MKRFFSVQSPLRFPDPIIPTGDPAPDPMPAPAPAPGSGSIICEFCECTLARSGDVLKVGKRAKRMRDLEDDIEGRDRTIAEKDAEIATLRSRVAELEAKQPKPSKNPWK